MIQIFGRNKCFETKKAERFFKERKVPFQHVDIDRYPLSRRELESVVSGIKDIKTVFDPKSKAYESLYVDYVSRTRAELFELLLENPTLYLTPIVRNGKQATVGSGQETVWIQWL